MGHEQKSAKTFDSYLGFRKKYGLEDVPLRFTER